MRVSNEHFNGSDGIRPIPENGRARAGQDRDRLQSGEVSFSYTVDWAKAEAKAEVEFSAQRTQLIHRLRDRDYPYPEVISQLARLVAGNFS